MAKRDLLSTLALTASTIALGVIVLGALTRLLDAGLGCPDWPGCYGHLLLPMNAIAQQLANAAYPKTTLVAYKAWIEMIHRYAVSALSLLILAIITLIFSKKKYRSIGNIIYVLLLSSLLIYQILLGQWTVTLKLLPIIVTQHLLGGFAIVSILWLIYLTNRCHSYSETILSGKSEKIPYQRSLFLLTLLGLLLLIVQLFLGAWTSTQYASLSCPHFPWCMNNQPFLQLFTAPHFKAAFTLLTPIGPNYTGGALAEITRQTIHMTHRLGALVIIIYFALILLLAMIQLKKLPALMTPLYCIAGLLLIQVFLGISNVIFKLPLINALCHTFVAALLLLSIITFLFYLATLPQKK